MYLSYRRFSGYIADEVINDLYFLNLFAVYLPDFPNQDTVYKPVQHYFIKFPDSPLFAKFINKEFNITLLRITLVKISGQILHPRFVVRLLRFKISHELYKALFGKYPF